MNNYDDLIKRLNEVVQQAWANGWWKGHVRRDVAEAVDAIQTLRAANRMQKATIDGLERELDRRAPVPLPFPLGPRHTLYLLEDGTATLEDTNNSDIMSLDDCNIELLAELLRLHVKEHGEKE